MAGIHSGLETLPSGATVDRRPPGYHALGGQAVSLCQDATIWGGRVTQHTLAEAKSQGDRYLHCLTLP